METQALENTQPTQAREKLEGGKRFVLQTTTNPKLTLRDLTLTLKKKAR